MSSLKLSRQLPCSVRFVFVSTFDPPTRKNICRWNHQLEQICCLRIGKSFGRPRVSEENVRRIQESYERSPGKSTRRASIELGEYRNRSAVCWNAVLLFNLSPSFFWITLYLYVILQIKCHKTRLAAYPHIQIYWSKKLQQQTSFFMSSYIGTEGWCWFMFRQAADGTINISRREFRNSCELCQTCSRCVLVQKIAPINKLPPDIYIYSHASLNDGDTCWETSR